MFHDGFHGLQLRDRIEFQARMPRDFSVAIGKSITKMWPLVRGAGLPKYWTLCVD
jgi:hypothetical protein